MPRRGAVVLAVLAAAGVAVAAATWVRLGARTVNFRTEHDVIRVGIDRGRFRAIRFEVRRHAVRIVDVKVTFGNRTVHDVPLRAVIPAGGRSRVIELPGGPRRIRRIDFVYRSAAPPPPARRGRRPRPKAVVEAWGLR